MAAGLSADGYVTSAKQNPKPNFNLKEKLMKNNPNKTRKGPALNIEDQRALASVYVAAMNVANNQDAINYAAELACKIRPYPYKERMEYLDTMLTKHFPDMTYAQRKAIIDSVCDAGA